MSQIDHSAQDWAHGASRPKRPGFFYDLTYLKTLERRDSRTVALRLLLILCCGITGWLALALPAFAFWALGYVLAVSVWLALLKRLPERLDGLGFVLLLVAALIYGASYIWIAWYAWLQPAPLLHYVAIIATFGMMINALSLRSDDRLMSLADLILASCTAIWMVFAHGLRGAPMRETLFLGMLLGAVLVFLLLSMRDANRTRRRLRQASRVELEQVKMQALGQLTGGVAHDFNNLLTVIIGNLDLRRSGDLSDEDHEELLGEVDAAARKASVLTAQLLSFSRRSPLEEQLVDLEDVLRGAQKLLRRLLPATHALELRCAPNLPRVIVDAGRLETVVVNLATNARDAAPAGGTITISAQMRDLALPLPFERSANALTGRALPPGRYAQICVSDTGSGIPAAIMSQVLEPYFTTKPVGKGSGLGLSMALGFAEQSGGTLSITSVEAEGTEVCLWLPVPD